LTHNHKIGTIKTESRKIEQVKLKKEQVGLSKIDTRRLSSCVNPQKGTTTMANIALGTDNKIHQASDFADSYKGDYFCANNACRVPMYLKNRGMTGTPYFTALGSNPHIANCEYKSSNSITSLDVSNFNLDEFFATAIIPAKQVKPSKNNPITQTKEENNTTISTVNKLYKYCLNHADNTQLPSGEYIWQIFQHERNQEISRQIRNNKRIIKLNFNNCNWKPKDGYIGIWGFYPFPTTSKPPAFSVYELKIKLSDKKAIFEPLCYRLTNLKERQKEVPIAVIGEWTATKCVITSTKQISILNE